MDTEIHRKDDMLLAARGPAGQLLLCIVLVWRAALRAVTLFWSHAHTHCSCMATHIVIQMVAHTV